MKNTLVLFSCIIASINVSIAQDGNKTSTQTTNSNTSNNSVMDNKSYSASFVVDQTPEQVFHAVNDPRAWWSEGIEGITDKAGAEFSHRYKDVHIVKLKVAELIPGKKVVWEVLANYFSFIKDQTEWVGTKIIFEIDQKDNKTQLTFTHLGLVPAYECYSICTDAWGNYIKNSLYELVTKGKGKPNPKEGGFNEQIVEKYKLQN